MLGCGGGICEWCGGICRVADVVGMIFSFSSLQIFSVLLIVPASIVEFELKNIFKPFVEPPSDSMRNNLSRANGSPCNMNLLLLLICVRTRTLSNRNTCDFEPFAVLREPSHRMNLDWFMRQGVAAPNESILSSM